MNILESAFRKFKDNKVLKAGAGYTIGNYLLKGFSFITVPIFARLLSTSDYGIFNTFMSYEGFLYLFIGLAIHSSVKNAKYKFGQEQLDNYTSSVTLIPSVISIFVLIVGLMFSSQIEAYLGLDTIQIILVVILSYCTSILYLYQCRLVLDYQTGQYLGLSYFNAISSIVFSLFFVCVVFPETKYLGRIFGSVIPMMLATVWMLFRLYKKSRPRYNQEFWKYGLKISLPIIPHGIGQVILTSFDRIMITNMIGSVESGLYSFAHSLYSIIQIAGSSLTTVIEPWVYEQLAEKKYKLIQKRSSLFIVALSIVCAGTMLVAPELVLILGSEKYSVAVPAVTPIVFGGFFAMAYSMPAIIEYFFEKTGYIAVGTVMAAILNLVLNAAMIPRFGYLAAAYTTLFSYLAYFIFHSVLAYKISGFNIIPLKTNILVVAFLSGISVIALKFEHNIFVRYLTGLVIVLIIGLYFLNLYKKTKAKSNEVKR